MQRTLVAVVVVLGMAIVAGCAPKKVPESMRAKPNPPAPAMDSPEARATALGQRASDLKRAASQLPGSTALDDRHLASKAFDAASSAVALLAGPNPSGVMRQQIQILHDTRNFLDNGPMAVSTEPATDTGLRALEGALQNVREELFPDNPRIRPSLAALDGYVRELDTVRGPTHALVVGQAFSAAADAISTMADELKARNQQPTTSR